MSSELAPPVESFALRGGRRALSLHATGFRHAAGWLAGGETFAGYDEITDLSLGRRGLRIGTLRSVLLLPRKLFVDADAPERLAAALVERIGREPDASLRLARMAEIGELARHGAPLRATWVAIALCIGVHLASLSIGPGVHEAGHFGSTYFRAGEWWRLLSANFLHGGLVHLALNAIGLLALGELVERPLGSARTALVLLASGSVGMLAGLAAGYEQTVGASGMVCGLAGAVVVLELRIPDRLPAAWRLPRRLLAVALGADALLSLVVPFIAGAVHLGGFFAGAAVAFAVTPVTPRTARVPAWVGAAAGVAIVAVVAVAATVARETVGGADSLARRAERLMALPGAPAVLLNNTAWMLVTSPEPTDAQIEIALRSAQRAVSQTGRSDPNFLDTLAESQFAAGRSEDAIETIDEAIALAPGEAYFLEQRRRFTGERAAEDRPAPPAEPDPEAIAPFLDPWSEPRELPPGHPPLDEEPGISV